MANVTEMVINAKTPIETKTGGESPEPALFTCIASSSDLSLKSAEERNKQIKNVTKNKLILFKCKKNK